MLSSRTKRPVYAYCPGFLHPVLKRIKSSVFLRHVYRLFVVIYRFVAPRYKVVFLRPYWGRAEFICGLKYSDRRSGHSIDALVERFRRKFNIVGAIIPTSSGRTAFELALKTLRKRYPTRQKVVIPTYGCTGIFDPIIRAGLVPVLVDVDKNLNIAAEAIEHHLKEDVLAILVPHLCGCKVEMEEVMLMARAKRICVIEDVCQALGGVDKGLFLGARGDMAIYSFGMGKNLMATAGGILTTRILEQEIQLEARKLGKEETALVKRRFRRTVWKYFCRLTLNMHKYKGSAYTYSEMHPLDAQLICLQLDKHEEIIEKRKENAQKTIRAFRKAGLKCRLQDQEDHVYTKLSIVCKDVREYRRIRNVFCESGIETERMYTPLHMEKPISQYASSEDLSYSESVYGLVLNIPVRPNLSEKEFSRILKVLDGVAGD